MDLFETRGEKLLEEFCKKFPDGSTEGSNQVLPPYYLTKHQETENDVNEARKDFDQQDEECKSKNKKRGDKLRGMAVNQTGDLTEREVYKLLFNCKVPNGYEFLSIHSFELDIKPKDRDQRPYKRALRSELPSFPDNIPMDIELDFAVIVGNVGAIGIEVKSFSTAQNLDEATKDNSLDKAEKQLTGGEGFLGALMSTVSGGSVLPYVRVICVPNDSTPSPSAKSHDGSYRLNSDIISQPQKFNSMLELFVKELIEQKAKATFTEQQFSRFTKFVVGLWTSESDSTGLVGLNKVAKGIYLVTSSLI